MEKCANCQAPLDPAWKFCVTCGTPTPADTPAAASTVAAKPKRTKAQPATAPAAEATPWAGNVLIEEIPAVIRNSQDGPPARATGRRRMDVSLIVSISLGVAGAALIVYLVILVFGTRG
jgi:hypothetical protein